MKEWKFFNDKNLTDEEMVELIQHFDFESYKTKDCIMNLGDQGDTFYILIKGAVSVLVKNPQIKDWNIEYKYYKKLKAWKEQFDVRAKEAEA